MKAKRVPMNAGKSKDKLRRLQAPLLGLRRRGPAIEVGPRQLQRGMGNLRVHDGRPQRRLSEDRQRSHKEEHLDRISAAPLFDFARFAKSRAAEQIVTHGDDGKQKAGHTDQRDYCGKTRVFVGRRAPASQPQPKREQG